MIDVILGLQWGDEGKGKIVDYFARDYQVIARFQGGPNAGHTLYINNDKIVLHQIPSGIFHENTINLIGNGVVLDPVTLKKKVNRLPDWGWTCEIICTSANEHKSYFPLIEHWTKPVKWLREKIKLGVRSRVSDRLIWTRPTQWFKGRRYTGKRF